MYVMFWTFVQKLTETHIFDVFINTKLLTQNIRRLGTNICGLDKFFVPCGDLKRNTAQPNKPNFLNLSN